MSYTAYEQHRELIDTLKTIADELQRIRIELEVNREMEIEKNPEGSTSEKAGWTIEYNFFTDQTVVSCLECGYGVSIDGPCGDPHDRGHCTCPGCGRDFK